jgi:hypothetical protein
MRCLNNERCAYCGKHAIQTMLDDFLKKKENGMYQSTIIFICIVLMILMQMVLYMFIYPVVVMPLVFILGRLVTFLSDSDTFFFFFFKRSKVWYCGFMVVNLINIMFTNVL